MGAVIALILFISWGVFGIVWLPRLSRSYELTEKSLKIWAFGIRMRNIPYEEIRYCEVVKAAKLWRPAGLLGSYNWYHTRWFVNGIIIQQSGWGKVVLTPENQKSSAS
jgi:hypothetical protein